MAESRATQICSFEEMQARVQQAMAGREPLRLLLISSPSDKALPAIATVVKRGWLKPILVGNQRETASASRACGVSTAGWEKIDVRGAYESAMAAAEIAAADGADLLMMGAMPAHEMLQVLLSGSNGYRRPGERLTHVGIFDIRSYPRLLLISDGGVMVHPTLEDRVVIIKQAASVARMFGVRRPRVALLAAIETVTEAMPVALESAALAKMGDRGQLGEVIVDGPLSIDVAVSPAAASIKHVVSEVSGRADIIVCSKIEVGNTLYKAMAIFAQARAAAIAIGTRNPLVMPSRSESHANRVHALEAALAYALHQRGLFNP